MFSASLKSAQRTSKIYGCLGEGSEAETGPRFREWRYNLTSWLASSSLTFITFVIPLANLLSCGDDPKSLTQLAKNEVYSNSMVSSLVIVLHDKFRHPVSTRQNDWKFSIIWEKICKLQSTITPDNSIIVDAGVKRYQLSGFSLVSVSLSSKRRTHHGRLRAVQSALFPLQHPLFLRVTVPYLCSCCLCCACCVVLFSLSRVLEPNASNWNTVSDQVSTLLCVFFSFGAVSF